MKLPRRMAAWPHGASIDSINFRSRDNDRIGFAMKTPKLIRVSSRLFDLCPRPRQENASLQRAKKTDPKVSVARDGGDCNSGIMSFLPRHCFAASNSALPSSRRGIRVCVSRITREGAARRRTKNVELPPNW